MNAVAPLDSNDATRRMPAIPKPDKPAVRLLLVDDDEADIAIVERVLSNSHLNIHTESATSGKAGLEMLRQDRFDAVLIDYQIADMTGSDFLDAIRGPDFAAIAAIIMTGAGDETIAAEVLKKGADDYLKKSDVNPGSIQRALQTAMQKVTLMKDLEQQRIELQRSNQELEQYAYVTSHDLQEPLRIIVSFLELFTARYGDQIDDKGREYVNYAVDGASRMQQMVASLLELSRIGRRKSVLKAHDLDELLGEAMANLKLSIEESGATVTHDPLPVISCNSARIIQLFQNLISNAIKYRREEAPRVHISVTPMPTSAVDRLSYATTIRHRTIWQFCVEDNGIGIDEQYAERIFIVFQRLHGRDEYPGTGIGLALCRKIVEMHGGKIWIRSTPGEGSKFYFTLPSSAADVPN